MRIDEARLQATRWVRQHSAGPEVVGAVFSGSTLGAEPEAELAAESDVDVILVTAGDAPAKLGPVDTDGLRLDVSFLSRSEIWDADAVARSFFLAPSFAQDAIIVDDDGHLRAVHEHVRRVFADPPVVRDRYADVLHRMDDRLAAVEQVGSWPERLLLWLFAASLPTQVLLVAGLRSPTVRLRYRAVRTLLDDRGLADHYPGLLAQLGTEALDADTVRAQLTLLPAVLDAAAAAAGAGATAADVGPVARAVAVTGTERLIAAGDHREAVFWLAVSLLRGQVVLETTAPGVAEQHRPAVLDAVATLTGLRTADDLVRRTAVLARARPGLVAMAEGLVSPPR